MKKARTIWRNSWYIPLSVSVLAMLVRLYYVNTAVVAQPVRGDAVQYVIYAINLLDHGAFSLQRDTIHPLPDSFREPGYPTFLALLMAMFGRGPTFYEATLNIQAVLSGLTAGMGAWIARRYIGLGSSVIVGIGLILWPHLVNAPGYLLSECLLGFLVMAALCAMALAIDRSSAGAATVSGFAFAAAALTNAVLLPLAPVVAGIAAWRDVSHRRVWAILAVAAILPCAAWMTRSAMIEPPPSADNRAIMNFVQGSWPEYHDAWRAAAIHQEPKGLATLGEIDRDYRRMLATPYAGIVSVVRRLASSPWASVKWYASKPAELWGWRIGIGADDIYVFATSRSPLSAHGILRMTSDIGFFLTPLLEVLALAGAVAAGLAWRNTHPALLMVVAITTWITLVFTIFQADARYATPYRPFEWLLAAYSIHWLRSRLITRPVHATGSHASSHPS